MKTIAATLYVCSVCGGGAAAVLAMRVNSQAVILSAMPMHRSYQVFSPQIRADIYLLDIEIGSDLAPGSLHIVARRSEGWDLQDPIDDADAFHAWAARQKAEVRLRTHVLTLADRPR